MPPRQKQVKTTLCSGKGKGNKQSTAATTAASLKRSDVDVESVISDTNTIDHQDISDVDDASSRSTTSSSKKLRVSKEVIDPPTMKKIAEWFSTQPMYYDQAHENYKNTQLRDMKLMEFSEEIGLSGELYCLVHDTGTI